MEAESLLLSSGQRLLSGGKQGAVSLQLDDKRKLGIRCKFGGAKIIKPSLKVKDQVNWVCKQDNIAKAQYFRKEASCLVVMEDQQLLRPS